MVSPHQVKLDAVVVASLEVPVVETLLQKGTAIVPVPVIDKDVDPVIGGGIVGLATAYPFTKRVAGRGVLLLEKEADGERAWIAINKDQGAASSVSLAALPAVRVLRVGRPDTDDGMGGSRLELEPAEVAYLVPA